MATPPETPAPRQVTELPLTPLADSQLSPGVLRAAGPQAPPPVKMMAARGLAPLPPPELAVALYQLAVTGDEALRKTAAETAGKLPEPVLKAALPAALDVRVLHFLALQLSARADALRLLLGNRALDDRTVEYLATVCGEDALDQIATDEARLLRSPAIIAALYMNPKARASTAMRAVELAARNKVVVDIPGYEDVVASLTGVTITAEHDARFKEVVPPEQAPAPAPEAAADNVTQEEIEKTQEVEEKKAADPEAAEKKQRFEDMPVPLQIRAATLGNAFDRSVAIRSTVRLVAMAAIKSPALTINEVVKFAANRALHQEVITYISNKKEWTALGSIRLALINNNKCPLGTALRFLPYLVARDLKAVSRSKNIPAPLVKAAKELIAKRERK